MSEQNKRKFLITWKIKNYFRTMCYEKNEIISTSSVRAENLRGSEWHLGIFPRATKEPYNNNRVVCYLAVPEGRKQFNEISVNCLFLLLKPNNIVFKSSEVFSRSFKVNDYPQLWDVTETDDLLREMSYWSEDTLTLQCLIECESDLMSSETVENPVIGCKVETELYSDSVYMWSFKISDFLGWSAIRETKVANMHMRVIFRYVDDKIRIYFTQKHEDRLMRLFLCDVTLIDETVSVLTTKKTKTLFLNRNKKFLFSFSKQDLQKARCCLLGKITFKFVFRCLSSIKLRRRWTTNETSAEMTSETESSSAEQKQNIRQSSKVDCFSYLQHDLRNLLEDKKFADIKLRVGNEVFTAHKNVLAARSPVFSAMFDQDMVERLSDTVDITNVDSKTLKLFLDYLYTSSIEKMDEEIALKLLVVADKYQVVPLVKKCSTFLKSVLSLTNVCQVLLTADRMNIECLKSSSYEYIVTNSTKVLTSPDWQNLLKMNNSLTNEVFIEMSKKFEDRTNEDEV